jgi:hypothetical protein
MISSRVVEIVRQRSSDTGSLVRHRDELDLVEIGRLAPGVAARRAVEPDVAVEAPEQGEAAGLEIDELVGPGADEQVGRERLGADLVEHALRVNGEATALAGQHAGQSDEWTRQPELDRVVIDLDHPLARTR